MSAVATPKTVTQVPALAHSRSLPAAVLPLLGLALVAFEIVAADRIDGLSVPLLALALALGALPLAPEVTRLPSVGLALLPVLAIGMFPLFCTSGAALGMPISPGAIRLGVAATVGAAAVAYLLAHARIERPERTALPREALAAGLVGALTLFTWWYAQRSYLVYPSPGQDWANYLNYARDIVRSGGLIVTDRFGMGGALPHAGDPGIGALNASRLMLDHVDPMRLQADGLLYRAALVPGAYAASAVLLGRRAAFGAAAVAATAPIAARPLTWGGTALAVGMVVLWVLTFAFVTVLHERSTYRASLFAGVALALCLVHRPVAAYAAAFAAIVFAALCADGVRRSAGGVTARLGAVLGDPRVRRLAAAAATALVVGLPTVTLVSRQAAELGNPPGVEAFREQLLTVDITILYMGAMILAVIPAAVAILMLRGTGRWLPLLVVVASTVAALALSQLWLVGIPFEYHRPLYFLLVPIAIGIGMAVSLLLEPPRQLALVGLIALLLVLALRQMPNWALTVDGSDVAAVEKVGAAERARGGTIVTDGCVGFVVAGVAQVRTLAAFADWQVGWDRQLVPVREARTILRGGRRGAELARRLNVDYLVLHRRCVPNAPRGLGLREVDRSRWLRIYAVGPRVRAAWRAGVS